MPAISSQSTAPSMRTPIQPRWPTAARGRSPASGRAPSACSTAIPVGVELVEELVAALLLRPLADGGRRPPQAVEGAEEAAVALVLPPDVAAPPPAVGPKCVEAAVVADPVAGVGLDIVAGEIAEGRPPFEEQRVVGDDVA